MERTFHRKCAKVPEDFVFFTLFCALAVLSCFSGDMPVSDIVFKLNRMDPVTFSHQRHLGVKPVEAASRSAGFSCGDCHPAPFENVSGGPIGMEVPHESGACAQCHNGRKRSDGMPPAFAANTRCLTCHKSPSP